MPQVFTDAQILAALEQTGTKDGAAALLGIGARGLRRRLQRMQTRGSYEPSASETGVPHGDYQGDYLAPALNANEIVGRRTVLRDPQTGEHKLEWIRATPDQASEFALAEAAIRAAAEDLPRLPVSHCPERADDALMTVIPIADPHIGMYAHIDETGANYSTKIAVNELCATVDYLVRQAPPSARCLILNLGDWYHADNFSGVTERSGNVLDVDTRMPLVIRQGMLALRQCLASALKHHAHVDLINLSGNHDEVLGCAIREAFSIIYENEPRVTVHTQPTSRQYLRHGRVLVGCTHGHQTKDRDLPGIMAAERPRDWGATTHRYFYRGHHHHDHRVEYNGCIVEQVRAAGQRDAYAVEHGYLSGRDLKAIVMHAEHGEVARSTCHPAMVKASGEPIG